MLERIHEIQSGFEPGSSELRSDSMQEVVLNQPHRAATLKCSTVSAYRCVVCVHVHPCYSSWKQFPRQHPRSVLFSAYFSVTILSAYYEGLIKGLKSNFPWGSMPPDPPNLPHALGTWSSSFIPRLHPLTWKRVGGILSASLVVASKQF